MKAIVAAASETARQDLAVRLGAAGFDAGLLVQDADELLDLLLVQGPHWVLTGGTADLARPFMRAASHAEAPVLALISGERTSLRAMLGRGAVAVLGTSASPQAMRAAAAAICEGLAVWEADEEQEVALDRTPTPLSPREREVLARVAAGLSNKVIARALSLSPNTVKFHLQAAFDKLGVASRAEAVAVAMRRGEISV